MPAVVSGALTRSGIDLRPLLGTTVPVEKGKVYRADARERPRAEPEHILHFFIDPGVWIEFSHVCCAVPHF